MDFGVYCEMWLATLSLALTPVVLLPVFLFAILHSASYSLTLLDVSAVLWRYIISICRIWQFTVEV
jgi:hypothetical protein